MIDPDVPDTGHLSNEPPNPPPTIIQILSQLDVTNQLHYKQHIANWDTAEHTTRRPRPIQDPPTKFKDIKDLYSIQLREYSVLQTEWSKNSACYTHMWNWVNTTV